MSNDMKFLTHQGCIEAILAAGSNLTTIILGEPGIGKTSMQKTIASILTTHQPIYLDMANMDHGDLLMRVPNHDSKTVEEYIGQVLCMNDPRPKLIDMDEIGKMPKIIQPTVTRMMLEHSVGDRKLPKGSVIWGTSNMTTDGLGDFIPAHTGNRIMVLHLGKPDADQTNVIYSNLGVSSITRAWIAMNRRVCASYLTCDKDELATNPFIFNPTKKQLSFCSMRSMHKNDTVVVKKIDRLKPHVAEAMMSGIIGSAAAHSMMTFMTMAKDVVPIKDVFDNPTTVHIPEKDAALFLMCFNALDELQTQDELSAFITYLDRKQSSMFEALFYTMALSNRKTMKLAQSNPKILKWMKIAGNYQMLG